MLQKDRRYILELGDYKTGNGVRITDLQLQFDVTKSSDNKKKSNQATVEVYNLSRSTLAALETEFLYCELSVGYAGDGTEPPNIMKILTGNVVHTTTVKRGTDTVTQLLLGEGYVELNHKRMKSLIAPDKEVEDVIEEIRKQMPGVARGAYVGLNAYSKILYGYPLNGSPREMLTRLCRELKLEWSLSNNTLNINPENGLLSTDTQDAPLISQETGLIDVPYYASGEVEKLATDKQRRQRVQFKALLNPAVTPGKLIRLESTVITRMTGFYRVNEIRYYGDYRGNDWYMECLCSQVNDVELKQ